MAGTWADTTAVILLHYNKSQNSSHIFPHTKHFPVVYKKDGWTLFTLGVFIGAIKTHMDVQKHAKSGI